MRQSLLFLALFVLCAGCGDIAARQHKAEQARRQQVQKDLKELGERMHNEQSGESATDSTATDAAKSPSDSPPRNHARPSDRDSDTLP